MFVFHQSQCSRNLLFSSGDPAISSHLFSIAHFLIESTLSIPYPIELYRSTLQLIPSFALATNSQSSIVPIPLEVADSHHLQNSIVVVLLLV